MFFLLFLFVLGARLQNVLGVRKLKYVCLFIFFYFLLRYFLKLCFLCFFMVPIFSYFSILFYLFIFVSIMCMFCYFSLFFPILASAVMRYLVVRCPILMNEYLYIYI